MSVDLSRTHPDLKQLISMLPVKFQVVSACRSYAEGLVIASWGRTVKNPYSPATADRPLGKKATGAIDPADSPHTVRDDGYSYAIDIGVTKLTPEDLAELRRIAEENGFVSGQSFKVDGEPDWGHIEIKGWRAIPCTQAVQQAGALAGLLILVVVGALCLKSLI